jgi:hypothetical protein
MPTGHIDPATLARLVASGQIDPVQVGIVSPTKGSATKGSAKSVSRSVRTDAPRRLRISFTIAARTTNEGNTGGSLGGKLARKRSEKDATREALPPTGWVSLPCAVILTRLSTGNRPQDDDNLRASLKRVRDEIAAWLGVDDGDRRVKWVYRELRAFTAGVRVEVRES